MRSNDAFLLDMLVAAKKIKGFTAGLTLEDFEQSDLHQSAVIRELQVIGEAAKSISEEVKLAHPEIQWTSVAGMRNRIVHEYFRVDIEIIWDVVENDVDALIKQLEAFVSLKDQE